jgi:ArsR family transcriptional regulator
MNTPSDNDDPNDSLQPQHCARMLRSLADPERLRIIQCLRDGPRNVGEIAGALAASIAKVSYHLGILRQTDVVRDEKHGRFVVYRLNPSVYRPTELADAAEHLDLGCCRLEIPKGA